MVFGLNITLIGMGLVFALLALLWLVLTLIGRIDALPFVQARPEAASPGEAEDPHLLAAIAVAIAAHRAASQKAAQNPARITVQGTRSPASPWASANRVYYGLRRKG